MLNAVLLSYITFVYFGAFMLYLLMMVSGKKVFGTAATWVSTVGLLAHSGAIVLRWVESYRMGMGHAPFSNLYESLIFFSWTICFLYLLVLGFARALGYAGVLPPALSAWLANFVFFLLALFWLMSVDR